MRNSTVIRGMRTREQYKVMEFISLHFEPGALEIELVGSETIRGTDRTGKSMIFSLESEYRDSRGIRGLRTVGFNAGREFNDTITPEELLLLFVRRRNTVIDVFQNRQKPTKTNKNRNRLQTRIS
ncbi:MAG: hypothetical protein ACLSEY_18495 [Enterocloster sp.]